MGTTHQIPNQPRGNLLRSAGSELHCVPVLPAPTRKGQAQQWPADTCYGMSRGAPFRGSFDLAEILLHRGRGQGLRRLFSSEKKLCASLRLGIKKWISTGYQANARGPRGWAY